MRELDLKDLASIARERVRADWDLPIAITGEEGVGKSNLGLLFSKECDENFSLQRNLLFAPDEYQIKKRITELPKYAVVNSDEAIRILYKLKWNNDIQIMLNQIYALCRQDNKISLFLIPRFIDLNEFFRNHRIKMWIHVIERGKAAVFIKDTNPFNHDTWHFEYMRQFMKQKKNALFAMMSTSDQIRFLQRNPCFYGIVKFGKVEANLWHEYEKLKAENKYSGILEQQNDPKRVKWKHRAYRVAMFIKLIHPELRWEEISNVAEVGMENIFRFEGMLPFKETLESGEFKTSILPLLERKIPHLADFLRNSSKKEDI